jgi:drug/metabolite transporter (DMT)-like permease
MNGIRVLGAVLLLLGLLSFVVPIPETKDHSVKIGDAKIGVQTESSQKLPPAAGVVLLLGGVLALAAGFRQT